MEKITNFLKTYWWIWLILLVVSALYLFFGAPAIGSFLYNLFGVLLSTALVSIFWIFTFGRNNSKSWGVFRILGLSGILIFCIFLSFIFEGKKGLYQASNDSLFNFSFLGLIFSILLFAVGEILLYLDKILQNSNKNIDADNFNMTCPTCYGKGFVDLDDIKRLGMEKKWGQGYCRYCDAKGKVERGDTFEKNPLNTENHGWHELAKNFNKD